MAYQRGLLELREAIAPDVAALTDKPFGVGTLLPASVRRDSAPQSGDEPKNPVALLDEYQQFAREFMEREQLP